MGESGDSGFGSGTAGAGEWATDGPDPGLVGSANSSSVDGTAEAFTPGTVGAGAASGSALLLSWGCFASAEAPAWLAGMAGGNGSVKSASGSAASISLPVGSFSNPKGSSGLKIVTPGLTSKGAPS